MNIRKLHRALGKVFAPFLIVASLTAIPLFWRNDEIFPESTRKLLLAIHTWEIGARYIGTILALVLIALSITGLILASRNKEPEEEGDDEDNPNGHDE